jgi:hypothetical protein
MAGDYVAVYIPSVSPVDTHTTSMWCPTRRAAALATDLAETGAGREVQEDLEKLKQNRDREMKEI